MENDLSILVETYNPSYCASLELAYGDHMMSEGGAEGIDLMFEDIFLEGKNALDFGSGLGGVAFYLANKHGMTITGVEINCELVENANKRIPANLKDRVSFVMSQGDAPLPFDDQHFSIIYSKGVLVHLNHEEKSKAFREFFRILKPGGKVIIHDWISRDHNQWSPGVQELMQSENLPLFACGVENYKYLLKLAGFDSLSFKDHSYAFANFNREVIHRLRFDVNHSFIEQFGSSTHAEHIQGYENIASTQANGETISALFIAQKTAHQLH